MKIGIYSPYLETLTGGELYIFTLAEILSNTHEVSLFWNDEKIVSKAESRFNLNLKKIKVIDNIFSSEYNSFERIKISAKFDKIVYLSDGSLPILPYKKLIVHFQFPILENHLSYLNKKKIYLADKIICNSNYTKRYIDKTYGVNSTIIYPPAQHIEGKNIKKKNQILTVGRYQPYSNGSDFKKIDHLIESFKMLNKRNTNWNLIIVTSVTDEHKKEFESRISKKINKSIKIIMNADFDTIKKSYQESKIYWHAAGFEEDTRKYPERAEHFGMSTAEAMSAGCVPVVVDLGGQSEIVEDGVNGFLWKTEKELLEKTQEIMDNKNKLESISLIAKESSQRFGKERFAKEIIEIFK